MQTLCFYWKYSEKKVKNTCISFDYEEKKNFSRRIFRALKLIQMTYILPPFARHYTYVFYYWDSSESFWIKCIVLVLHYIIFSCLHVGLCCGHALRR